jgi:hypothetical protein
MTNHYLIEVTQRQQIIVAIDAQTLQEAIELISNQQGEIIQTYPTEIEGLNVLPT